jgi:hypothetical protein
MTTPLPQQVAYGHFAAPKRQPSPQHGQKAQATAPVTLPPRSFEPRPGH